MKEELQMALDELGSYLDFLSSFTLMILAALAIFEFARSVFRSESFNPSRLLIYVALMLGILALRLMSMI